MNWVARARFLHRAWRYRLRSEKFGIAFLLSRDLRGRTAVDIGANRGIYSYWMSGCVGKAGRVVAFEPQPELAAVLRDLRVAFGLHQIEIAETGLSCEDAALILRRPKTHWGNASFEYHADDADAVDLIPVDVTTLDGYFANHPGRPIAFIKCDVEGHEYPVFRGGQKILTEDRPDLLFECVRAGDSECDVFTYLQSLDYDGYCFFGGGLAAIADYRSLRPKMHRKALVDFVFVPKERAHGRTRP